jgi:hypothetical protein
MPVRSARRASRQGMSRRPVAAGQSPDRDRSRPRVGLMCLIALVATSGRTRPGVTGSRIALVATSGSRYLQHGARSRPTCHCPSSARSALTWQRQFIWPAPRLSAHAVVAGSARRLHLSRSGTANFDGKICERAALAVNCPTYLAPDSGGKSGRFRCCAATHNHAASGPVGVGARTKGYLWFWRVP